MSNWEPGIIPLAANFQNNTEEPLDAREVVSNRTGLNEIGFPYPGLIVYIEAGQESYLCLDTTNISTSYDVSTGVNVINWKKIHDDSLIDGGEF